MRPARTARMSRMLPIVTTRVMGFKDEINCRIQDRKESESKENEVEEDMNDTDEENGLQKKSTLHDEHRLATLVILESEI